MNCAHSARSFPSGGRSATRTATIKMGASVSRHRRTCPETRCPQNVMIANILGSFPDRGLSGRSCQNLSHDAGRLYAGQFLFQTLKRIMKLVMVEAQQIKDSRMQVADLHRVFYDFISHLVGLAVRDSWLDAAARHPNRERPGIMVPANIFHFLTIAILPHGCPAKSSAPPDECVLEHAALFQIS